MQLPLKLREKKERKEEKQLLSQIRELPEVIICFIYEYMTGKAKFICNKKYEYLEKNVKDDSKNKFVFWKYLNTFFDKIEKKQVLRYLYEVIIPNHISIIDRIWYHSKENDNYYTGKDLLILWEKDKIDIGYYGEIRDGVNNHIKVRIVDAIYYYILRSIEVYTSYKKMHMCNKYENSVYTNTLDYRDIYHKIDKVFRLCKSIEILSFENK